MGFFNSCWPFGQQLYKLDIAALLEETKKSKVYAEESERSSESAQAFAGDAQTAAQNAEEYAAALLPVFGTWEPKMLNAQTGKPRSNVTYQEGTYARYVKVGNIVFFDVNINYRLTGPDYITAAVDLPFASIFGSATVSRCYHVVAESPTTAVFDPVSMMVSDNQANLLINGSPAYWSIESHPLTFSGYLVLEE